jgi:glycosyltransferase involved in cell wall biosynthesis/O-antigen ligase
MLVDRDLISLVLPLSGFVALCWIFRAHLTEFALASAIVLTPLAHASFVPQQLFGLPGINPVNVIWLFAVACVMWGVLAADVKLALLRFFGWPLLLFGAVYWIAVLRTGLDIESLLPDDPGDRPSVKTLVVFLGIKPLQYVLTGFLVCLYGIRNRTLVAAEKALLALPLLWVWAVVAYYIVGSAGADTPEYVYKAGRNAISEGLGIHANYMGRMALYLLLFALSARNLPWRRALPFSIFASVVLIALSFSRSVYVAGAILLPFALYKSSWRERLWVVGSIFAVTLFLYPQLSSRVQYGMEPRLQEAFVEQSDAVDEKPKQLKSGGISAGRIGRIWPLVWPNVVAHPWVGQGLLSVWKPVDRERGLNYGHPHNAYLEVALDAGLVGLIAMALMLGWIWRMSVHYPPLRYVLAGWALMSITGDTFYPHLQNSLNWIVLGMAVVAGSVESLRAPDVRPVKERSGLRPGICFVSDGAFPLLADRMTSARIGGAELQQVLLGEELIRRGYEVSFVTPDHGQGLDARIGPFRVFGSWKPSAGLPVIRFIYPRWVGLWRALKRADADVYLVRTASKEIATVALFARRQGRRSIYCGASDSDFEPEALHLPRALDRGLYLWGLRHCDAVVSQNQRQRKSVRIHYERDSTLIHNGFITGGHPAPVPGRVLWVATFRDSKQPRLLLEVAARLPEIQFAMVGGASWGLRDDPGLFEAVAAEAAALPNLEVRGALPLAETEAEFDRASFFVSTSSGEGFPNTFLQAWSRGIPVISFLDPDGLIRENGLGSAVADADEMVSALSDFISGTTSLSREAIRDYFDAHFSIEQLGDRYEALFASLRSTG